MNDVEIKQLFDIIFMMVFSLVMAMALVYGLYRGAIFMWKKHKKSKVLRKIQDYVDNKQFQQVISFDKEGLPVMVEISEEKVKKIVSL